MRIGIDCRKAADYGIGTYIRGLLSGLAQLRLDDEFLLFAPPSLFEALPDAPNFARIAESSPNYSVRELINVGRAAERNQVDLLHATHYVVPFTGLPVVVTIHDLIHLKPAMRRRHPLAPVYARWMLGRAARKSAGILTATEAVRQDIERFFPAAREKITMSRFGVAEAFSPAPVDPVRLARHGLQPGTYFLFVGNDKPHKNLDRLVEAFQLLRRGRRGLDLALTGGTTRFSGPGIVNTGFVEEQELPHLYRGAVALIQPSIEEGFGMPVVEAMACGTAVVISSQPALIEVAGDAALIVDPLSSESIASGMLRIALDDSLRARLSEAGRLRARSFSWRSCAEETLQVYRRVLVS